MHNLKLGDEVNGVLDSGDGGSLFLRDLGVEFLLDGHDQFNGVKGVSTKVIDEGGTGDNLVGINAQLLNNDIFDLSLQFGEKLGAGSGSKGRVGGEGGGSSEEGEEDGLVHGDRV
jgi:hypothetical protein